MDVGHNEAARRFEMKTQNGVAVIDYRTAPGEVEFYHTEVPEADRGNGLGSEIAAAAVEWARRERLRIVPTCPFIRRYLQTEGSDASP
jgi:predicted GNAT family acetyltransferase